MERRISLCVTTCLATLGLVAALPALSAQAPVKGKHHFAFDGQQPIVKLPTETDKIDLTADMTENRFTIQDEVWNPGYDVPLHFHKRHAEVFYVLSGSVAWTLGNETHVMHAGDLAYIPPNTPHKVHVVGDEPYRGLFLTTPGGYELHERIQEKFSKDELSTPAAVALLGALSDFNPLPDDASIPNYEAGPAPHPGVPHFALGAKVRSVTNPSGNVTSRVLLSGPQSEGRFTIQDENWPADFNVGLHYHAGHAEVFYVIGGAVEWTVDGETHVMHHGDLVYIPPNTPHKVHVVGGQPSHMLFLQTPGGYEMAIDLRNEYSEKQRSAPAAKAALDDLHDYHSLPDSNAYKPASTN